ncbi:hypothetical protein ACFO6R_09995 [Eubacterium multiforme]|uniref:Uncharacterized protein n=1 Tax=Eubacterium multiforme TaxID=83339 RepID=A0ABT9USW3_9FIRM|nr:hypothetical protein [Eubacterium multiforme]MDQ0149386.1 hypothetical protein [Eubacterium multiforme]
MKNKMKKSGTASIILYVIAVIIIFYMIWTLINCHQYIQTMIAQGGLTVSGNGFNIVSYYMTNCAQYGLFAVVLIVLGVILQKLNTIQEIVSSETNKSKEDSNDK